MPRAHPVAPLLAALLLSVVPVQSMRAQWQAGVELSGARLRQDERPSTGALTLGSTVAYAGPRLAVDAVALGTFGAGSQRTAQALGSATWFGANARRARWSLGVAGSAFAEPGSESSVSGNLNARQQLLFGAGGSWAGLAIGGVSDRGDRFAVRSLDAGVWQGRGAVQSLLSATLVDTRAARFITVRDSFHLVTEPVTYTDVGPMLRWEPLRPDGSPRARLSLSGGARFISRGASDGPTTKGYGGVDLELPLAAGLGLSASFGRQLSDLARGTPASRYASIGLRLDMRRASARGAERAGGAQQTESRTPRLELLSGERGASIAVGAREASRVELSSSFTDWEPVSLERREGRWVFPRDVPSGTHRLLLRIDGGAWMVPANLASIDDEDGGKVALLVVP